MQAQIEQKTKEVQKQRDVAIESMDLVTKDIQNSASILQRLTEGRVLIAGQIKTWQAVLSSIPSTIAAALKMDKTVLNLVAMSAQTADPATGT